MFIIWFLGVHQLVLFATLHNSTRLATLDFPIFPRQLDEQFRQLTSKFYKLQAICAINLSDDINDCKHTLWSSHYPDSKTQIITGFNQSLGILN
jgi:hypothetical protein